MSFPLALTFLQNLVVFLFVLVCLAIILIVLLQKGRGGGIGAAFGGGGAGSLLGTKTGDFLTWVTICLVAAFLVLAVLMGKFLRPEMPSIATPPIGVPTAQPAEIPAGADDAALPAAEVPTEESTPVPAEEPEAAADETTE
jgi:preprotein translocase subunit SecG